MERLYRKIEDHFDIDESCEVAIEIDPRTVNHDKIEKLHMLGFNRISMGVQDFDETVQKHVNRFQPFDRVYEIDRLLHQYTFHSINYDLIYGLPYQTQESFMKTVNKVVQMNPDRIALYSFAYVPWLKRHQRKIDPQTLPSNETKIDIFWAAREMFMREGYDAIAMDHFALKNDELAKAYNQGQLYRNFMGYTVKPADEYIGLGLTSIGFLENTFVQNCKILPEYYSLLNKGKLPVERGKILCRDDKIRQWTINSFMCQFRLNKLVFSELFGVHFDKYFDDEKSHLLRCCDDGLIAIDQNLIQVTDLGKLFIRNICMGFDHYLKDKSQSRRFSRTV